jgi:hypothetical protein
MTYSAEISRANPTCILFLVDQSYSMGEMFGSTSGVKKADFVAEALNKTLYNLVITCSKGQDIRDYFDVGVLGYGGAGIGPALTGPLAGRKLVKISEVGANPAQMVKQRLKMPDGTRGTVEYDVDMPVWFYPTYSGGTPMYEAFSLAKTILLAWTATHRDSFPPTVLHVTDGDWNGTDPSHVADEIMSLGTNDGKALLLNLHVSGQDLEPVLFPADGDPLPSDRFARDLFQMSSPLTPRMVDLASSIDRLRRVVGQGSRGYVFNGGIEDVISFFDIGTQPANIGGSHP